jgi:hypothetical protein
MEKPKNNKRPENPEKTYLKNSPEEEKTPTGPGPCQESCGRRLLVRARGRSIGIAEEGSEQRKDSTNIG